MDATTYVVETARPASTCGIRTGAEEMGIEYKIRFAVPPDYNPGPLFQKLPSPIHRRAMAEIYNYAIEADGFYFVDHLVDRGVAAVALRSFLDEALRLVPSVEIVAP